MNKITIVNGHDNSNVQIELPFVPNKGDIIELYTGLRGEVVSRNIEYAQDKSFSIKLMIW